jgi:hypothetical protein
MGRERRIGTAVLGAFCALALVSLAFAHRPVQAYAAPVFLSADYQLPDGSYADLCVSDHGVSHDPVGGDAYRCDVCRLVSSFLLPSPGHDHWLKSDFVSIAAALDQSTASFGSVPVERVRSRGPPVSA